MNFTKHLLKTIAALLLLSIAGSDAAVAQIKVTPTDYDTYKVRDLALIYQGNKRRPKWDVEDFIPYVSHKFADGHRDWTFDGFLFLEFDNGEGVSFVPSLGKMGTKKEWQWYLDKLFEEGTSLDALDACIDSLKTVIGKPDFRHKIVLTILTPCLTTKNWGEINGRQLDMSSYEDASLAAKWYIDQMVERFKEKKYRNFDLVGLYWLDEDLCHTFDLPKHVAPYVHAHNLDFIWIPYYNARGLGTWREQGFDMVYMQPNYVFDSSIHHLRLRDSTDLARGLGIGLELEMDDNSLYEASPVSTYDRFKDYVDWFKESGVWERSGVAYYTDNQAIKKMSESPQPRNKQLLDELFNIIIQRRANKKLVKK